MEKEQKDSIEHLMYHIQKNNYKEICDMIKVVILDKFIELAKNNNGYLSIHDLQTIREGIEELRTKDKEVETKAIVLAIDNLISRGDNNLTKSKEVSVNSSHE